MPAATATRFTVRPSRRLAAGTAPLAQGAYTHLLQQLLEGDLKPGDWLSVMDISTQLQCSRVPVMEALKRLDTEGFVEITPQVGCRVARPNAAEVQDFFELFAAVEGCVTGLAAARRTTADLPAFKALCRRIDLELKTAGPPAARDPRRILPPSSRPSFAPRERPDLRRFRSRAAAAPVAPGVLALIAEQEAGAVPGC